MNGPCTKWAVERRLPGGIVSRIGTVVMAADGGFRFVPNVFGRKPSRKDHATLQGCLPRWVGYPDNCETRRL